MSGGFYELLLYSLLLTTGSFLLYFLYRYFIRRAAGNLPPVRYIILRELKQFRGEKKIVFFIDVPEEIKMNISIFTANDNRNVIQLEKDALHQGLVQQEVDLHSLESGEYYLKISSDKQEITRKFVLV